MVDFLSDKDREKNKAAPIGDKVEWSQPPEEKNSLALKGFGLFGIFKDRDKEAIKREQFNRSRREVLNLIQDYVSGKEVGDEGGKVAVGKKEPEAVKAGSRNWLELFSFSSGKKEVEKIRQIANPVPDKTGIVKDLEVKNASQSKDEAKAVAMPKPEQAAISITPVPKEFSKPITQAVPGKQHSAKRGKLSGLFKYGKPKAKGEGAILATDLIKREVVNYFDWKKNVSVLAGVVAVCLMILVAANYGLNFWEKQKIVQFSLLSDSAKGLSEQIVYAENDINKIVAFQKKAELVKSLLDGHIYWTNFFKFLEENTLADVSLDNFTGDVGGNYILGAKTKDFSTLAQQISVLRQNSDILQAFTNGGEVVLEDKNRVVAFELNIKLDPKIFFNK